MTCIMAARSRRASRYHSPNRDLKFDRSLSSFRGREGGAFGSNTFGMASVNVRVNTLPAALPVALPVAMPVAMPGPMPVSMPKAFPVPGEAARIKAEEAARIQEAEEAARIKAAEEAARIQAAEAAELASKEAAEKVFAEAAKGGFFSHFKVYLMELLMPWRLIASNTVLMEAPGVKEKAIVFGLQAKEEIMTTLTLAPPPDPRKKFITYNALGFWLGIVETLFVVEKFAIAWNGVVGFIVAYTLYWTMTCSNSLPYAKTAMFGSLCFIALYILFNLYMGYKTLLYIVPACMYFGKALCDVLMIINGYHLYKPVAGDRLLPDHQDMMEVITISRVRVGSHGMV